MVPQPAQAATPASALAHGARLLRSDPEAAVAQAREVLRVAPQNADAFRLLGRALRALGCQDEAEAAELDAIAASAFDTVLITAARALIDNDIPMAEALLRQRLKKNPFDVAAIRMMAEVAARIGRFADAENLLRRALELAPAFNAARTNLATVLHRQHRSAEAIELLEALLIDDPDNPSAQSLKAAALGRVGSYEEAARLYRDVLERQPDRPPIWMSYGHVLKTIGRTDEAIAAYRHAITLAPGFGEVWWSLANLKTFRFTVEDLTCMAEALALDSLSTDDRLHLHFALGKAFEDEGRIEESFRHYAEGNRLRRDMLGYDAGDVSAHVARSIRLFSPEFFEERDGWGFPATDPIFVLGMPRAGSTLIEQILASHPAIEGTSELPDIPNMVKRLTRQFGERSDAYPDCLRDMDAEVLARMGADYVDRTRVHRKSDRPHFIDKMPNNWLQLGLICLMLPNARIIDARRHPLDCCFSNFKQHFARGQGFTYSLEDLGRYYRDYVRLMRHFDAVLPGRIHRVIHEQLLDDPEAEVRRMLDFLGLPFEPACLRFHENRRAVRTASSEQVRRPINKDGIGQWRPFEPWLGPLKQALGPLLRTYPALPDQLD